MAIAVNSTKEALAIAYATTTNSWISLHTGDPGSTGTAEATGGSPAYARKQTTWTAGAVDGISQGSQVTIDVPAGTYTFVGIWTAATGGSFVDKVAITSTTLGAQGQILVTPKITIS
ncbi:phage tail fiber protein [Rhodococcoides fascians]|uniref:phage tail fiber protein n=1 Tax=Rhodococcoides fascians TaxID=1828 RepID=UPI00050D026A|nr:hypothetical protein [Rhodococcus fascians]